MAQTYDTFWQQKFARALETKMQHYAEIVCSGTCDPMDYKRQTGIIHGLQMAIETIDELNAEIRKAEAGGK
jgi:hypothetical protein